MPQFGQGILGRFRIICCFIFSWKSAQPQGSPSVGGPKVLDRRGGGQRMHQTLDGKGSKDP